MLQRVFVMIPAKVWSMGMGRTVTCPPCILLTRNVNGNAEIFLPAFSGDALHSLWVYLQGLAGWNAFWNVPGSEPNPALECEVKCWRYKYRV